MFCSCPVDSVYAGFLFPRNVSLESDFAIMKTKKDFSPAQVSCYLNTQTTEYVNKNHHHHV